MIKIEMIDRNPAWQVYRANLVSIGKRPTKPEDYAFSVDWCLAQLHAEHSTLEQIDIRIFDDALRGDTVSHLVRHTKGHPRHIVQSWRPDWTGKPRPSSDTPRWYLGKWNLYALIAEMRQRLCPAASAHTVKWSLELKAALIAHPDPMLQALGIYVMPDCDYRGGICHQLRHIACGRCRHYTDSGE